MPVHPLLLEGYRQDQQSRLEGAERDIAGRDRCFLHLLIQAVARAQRQQTYNCAARTYLHARAAA